MNYSASLLALALTFLSGALQASTLTIGAAGADDPQILDGMVEFNDPPVSGDMQLSAVAVNIALVSSDVTLQRAEGITVNDGVTNVTGSTLTLQTAGSDDGSIVLNAGVELNGTLALQAACSPFGSCSGSIVQSGNFNNSGAISAGALEVHASNRVVLTGSGNDFGTVSGAAGFSIDLTDQNGLDVTGLSADFSININAGGQVAVPLLASVFETDFLSLTAESFLIDTAGASLTDNQVIQVLAADFFAVSLLDSDVKVSGLDPAFLLDTTSLFSSGQVVVRSVPDMQVVPLPSSLFLSLTVLGALCGLRRCTLGNSRRNV